MKKVNPLKQKNYEIHRFFRKELIFSVFEMTGFCCFPVDILREAGYIAEQGGKDHE